MDRDKDRGAVLPITETSESGNVTVRVRHMTEDAAVRTAKKVGRLPWVIVTTAAQADDEMIERINWCLDTYGKVQIVKIPEGEQE